jgi:hypothetical protein
MPDNKAHNKLKAVKRMYEEKLLRVSKRFGTPDRNI